VSLVPSQDCPPAMPELFPFSFFDQSGSLRGLDVPYCFRAQGLRVLNFCCMCPSGFAWRRSITLLSPRALTVRVSLFFQIGHPGAVDLGRPPLPKSLPPRPPSSNVRAVIYLGDQACRRLFSPVQRCRFTDTEQRRGNRVTIGRPLSLCPSCVLFRHPRCYSRRNFSPLQFRLLGFFVYREI